MNGNSSAVIVGVGPGRGLGAALARRFAQGGLCVYAVGRTMAKLEQVVGEIEGQNGRAVPWVADATVEAEVVRLFETVARDTVPEVVVYNVDRNERAPLLETSAELFEDLWRKNCLGGFLVGREAVRAFLPRRRGTLFFTGATASLRARPPFTAFAAAKTGLRALAQGMAREFGPEGIHVVHAVIDGVIDGERARRQFPEFVEAKGEEGLLDPKAIAETYWTLHRQPRNAWTHEIDLRPYRESF
ncbi:MAG TPA: SDR family NAD(P)-dependent oxidoreductase [Methylococcus sp.]|nr:SDR family NAD(P)-dependent oxidoreductase [Methylococcus sp.]